jgi:acetoin utilization deacetylase AcuC-like enzyme
MPAREATDTELIAVHNPALIQAMQDASAAAATAQTSHKHGTDAGAKQQAGDAGNINVSTGRTDTAMQHQAADTGQGGSHQGSKGSDDQNVRENEDEEDGQDEDEGEEEEEEEEPYAISADSLVSAGTYHAARLAAGSAALLAQQLVAAHVHSGIAVIRPPGEHC